MNNLGDRLYSLRKSNSLTQEALAAALNERYDLKVNKSMVSKWENNIDTPSLNSAKYIAIFFDVSLDFLLGVSGDKNVVAVDVPAPADPLQLTEQEEKLIATFRSLNDSQKVRLLAYLDGLLDAGKEVKVKDAGSSVLTDLVYYDYKPASGMVAESIAEYNCGHKTQAKKSVDGSATIAAHHDSDDWTEDELAEIEKFKKYVKTEREY